MICVNWLLSGGLCGLLEIKPSSRMMRCLPLRRFCLLKPLVEIEIRLIWRSVRLVRLVVRVMLVRYLERVKFKGKFGGTSLIKGVLKLTLMVLNCIMVVPIVTLLLEI